MGEYLWNQISVKLGSRYIGNSSVEQYVRSSVNWIAIIFSIQVTLINFTLKEHQPTGRTSDAKVSYATRRLCGWPRARRLMIQKGQGCSTTLGKQKAQGCFSYQW